METRVVVTVCFLVALMVGCQSTGVRPLDTRATGGEHVASRINARYEDRRRDCGDATAAYFCSGVIYRAIDWRPDYYFWNNTIHADYDGVSFSYLRRDSGTRSTFRATGYIVTQASAWAGIGLYPFAMYCSFPFDGMTGADRGAHGCDASAIAGSEPCATQGIVTVAQFARHYGEQEHASQRYLRWYHQCSFSVDAESFHTSILARQGGSLEPERGERYSEVVLRTWPADVPGQLPLEAIYFDPAGGEEALTGARNMQVDFRMATGRTLPVLRWSDDLQGPPFSFNAKDQAPPGFPVRGGMRSQGSPASYREAMQGAP